MLSDESRAVAKNIVEVVIGNAKLARVLNVEANLLRAYDVASAREIRLRMAALVAFPTLADVPERLPDGRHYFIDGPEPRFAVYAGPNHRIVFEPTAPVPKTLRGRVHLRKVVAVTIVDITKET